MNDLEKKPKPPLLRLKNRGGAPKGNSNALKAGVYAGETLARRAKVRAMVRHARELIALALAGAREK
jgi:hypothetical protein